MPAAVLGARYQGQLGGGSFDAYCEANNITEDEAPMAFAAFLNLRTGWDGEATKVEPGFDAAKGER